MQSSYGPGTRLGPTRSGHGAGELQASTAGSSQAAACRNAGPLTLKTRHFLPLRNALQQSDLLIAQEHLSKRKGCQKLQLRVKTIISTYVPASRCHLTQGFLSKQTDAGFCSRFSCWHHQKTQKSLCTWDTFCLF